MTGLFAELFGCLLSWRRGELASLAAIGLYTLLVGAALMSELRMIFSLLPKPVLWDPKTSSSVFQTL